MFSYYAQRFPLVELNYTFYRPPTPEGLHKLAAQAPDGFQFIVKLHQSFSHEHDLSGAAAFRHALAPLEQEDRLLALLCQYPQRFHRDAENLDRLAALADRFAGLPLAVEFRHQSWAVPETAAWLHERCLHLVSVDVPDIPNLFPSGLVQSSRLVYARFHSRRKYAWYGSDKDRYDYFYSDDELKEWLRALEEKRHDADRAYLLFNNCQRSHAVVNARRVFELLEQSSLASEVVQPFAPTDDAQQQLLF
jgi:uncharacterized protein YecE (DUF72 family)